jgi:chorismate dehydratase
LPVHAQLLAEPRPGLRIVTGTPGELNLALVKGDIDLAPCSSIEYARQAARYRLIPGLVIGSHGRVRSIRLESTVPLAELDGRTVAVPTASATSVVLLRILLERCYGSRASFIWFTQEAAHDPVPDQAAAALWIGDQALQRSAPAGREIHDLGELWTSWTGLPFAFALWQTGLGPERDEELRGLAARLHASLHSSLTQPLRLAQQYAEQFGMTPEQLADYWSGLHFTLDEAMLRGLTRFFELAAELGEIPDVPPFRWLTD